LVQVKCANSEKIGRKLMSGPSQHTGGLYPAALASLLRKPPALFAGPRFLVYGGVAVAGAGIAAAMASDMDYMQATKAGSACPSFQEICAAGGTGASAISANCGCPGGTMQSMPQNCFPGDNSLGCVSCSC
jgi:hypothetical protein